jgi:transcription elongation factor Elf1
VSDTDKGFTCKPCGTYHKYPSYVYAHWDMTLTHTCPKCGAKHEIVSGVATLTEKGDK